MASEPNALGAAGGESVVLEPSELAHGAVRGAIAAMAMTGMRTLTVNLGLVEQPPPQAIFRQKARGLVRRVPPRLMARGLMRRAPLRLRRSAEELAHWGYGAQGGMVFAALPDRVRHKPWAGPIYGVVIWLGFELGIAPALGLSQAKKARPVDRIMLAADHVLYGFVLSEMRRRAA